MEYAPRLQNWEMFFLQSAKCQYSRPPPRLLPVHEIHVTLRLTRRKKKEKLNELVLKLLSLAKFT